MDSWLKQLEGFDIEKVIDVAVDEFPKKQARTVGPKDHHWSATSVGNERAKNAHLFWEDFGLEVRSRARACFLSPACMLACPSCMHANAPPCFF